MSTCKLLLKAKSHGSETKLVLCLYNLNILLHGGKKINNKKNRNGLIRSPYKNVLPPQNTEPGLTLSHWQWLTLFGRLTQQCVDF